MTLKISTGQVLIAASSVEQIVPARVGRKSLRLTRQSGGTSTFFLGSSDSVTATTGYPVGILQDYRLNTEEALYGLAGSTGSYTVTYLEEYEE